MVSPEPTAVITSPRNPRLAAVRRLAQRKYRYQTRRFTVEGLQLLHLGLAAGVVPESVLYCESLFTGEGAPSLLERCRQTAAELIPVSAQVMAALSSRDAPQGLVAIFPLVDAAVESLELIGSELVLVLDRLQNPGNLGTLVRTADAVGAAAVVLLEPGADPYDPAAVRSSMGSLFSLPLARSGDPAAVLSLLRHRGLRVVAADPYQGQIWHRASWDGGVALVLGNEARGLSPELRPQVDEWVRLPMRGQTESLNVAVVGGVLAYAWSAANPGSPDP
ncbi:MAG: RNA methyltransferase [Candidatus Latescibacterota bacterium]